MVPHANLNNRCGSDPEQRTLGRCWEKSSRRLSPCGRPTRQPKWRNAWMFPPCPSTMPQPMTDRSRKSARRCRYRRRSRRPSISPPKTCSNGFLLLPCGPPLAREKKNKTASPRLEHRNRLGRRITKANWSEAHAGQINPPPVTDCWVPVSTLFHHDYSLPFHGYGFQTKSDQPSSNLAGTGPVAGRCS